MDTINYKGEDYRKQGDSWVNAKTNVKPPLIIIQELERQLRLSSKDVVEIAPAKISGTRIKKHPGRDFTGLKSHDFSTDTTGTHWRQETTLKGLLTHQLSVRTGRNFEARSISYRPQVLIGEPPRFDKGNPDGFNFKKAKFNFRLNESEALYTFYIEKSHKEMDSTWEWPQFIHALRQPEITTRLESAMKTHNLYFSIETWIGGTKKPRSQWVVELGRPLLLVHDAERRTISWADLVSDLESVSQTDWCDVNLGGSISKGDAISAGAEVTKPVIDTFVELLPLYDACAGRLK